MGLASRFLRVPKPKRFLYFTSLSTGASLITLSLLINKLSGVYGILALVTGFELSPLQFSMYLYSIMALCLTVYLMPHIKTQSPVFCLALSCFYTLDSIINALYTTAFASTWFLVLLQHGKGEDVTKAGPGAGTIGDTAGFTDPQYNVSKVEVLATPQAEDYTAAAGKDAVAGGHPASTAAGVGDVEGLVWGRESINSITTIVSLWTIRAYFCVVMLAWARTVLRSHIANMQARQASAASTDYSAGVTLKDGMFEDPFAIGKPDGQGWKGKLGRFLVKLAPRYWLGLDETQSWVHAANARFGFRRHGSGSTTHSNSGSSSNGSNNGGNMKLNGGHSKQNSGAGETIPMMAVNKERENRRRSGTGPPLPNVQAAAGIGAAETTEKEG